MNLKKNSCINSSGKDNGYGAMITLTIALFVLIVTPGTLWSQSFTTVQITDNLEDDTQVDACVDNLGNLHAVYQRDGKIIYRHPNGNENYVSDGTTPAVAVDSLNKPYIAFTFQDNEQDKVGWVAKQNGSWGTTTTIGNGSDPDIVVDSDGYVHLAYSEISYYWSGYVSSTMYAHNRNGDFEVETIFQGYDNSYLSSSTSTQFYYPSLKIDAAGEYHISAYKHYLNRLWGDTINSDMWINYKTNKNGEAETLSSPSLTKTSEPFYGKNCLTLGDDGKAYVAYVFNGNLYYAEITDTWSESSITGALQASIGRGAGTVEIVYSDTSNQIQYIQNSGSGFSTPSQIGSGQSPVLTEGISCTFYSKWDGHDLEIYKACESSILPALTVNRDRLTFSAAAGGVTTGSQDVMIDREGSGGPVYWDVVDDAAWLLCSPVSGADSGVVSVSVDVAGFGAGEYTGTITVSSPDASNSPRTIPVVFNVYESGQTSEPFGVFATPTEGSTVRASIPVTGWVLDDVGVENVTICWRSGCAPGYTDYAIPVEGARPDVEQAFPGYPINYKAGWGYMLLTNFLPEGDGVYIISAIARDVEGNEVILGTKSILVDNASAVKPFGAIDTPAQGGMAPGSDYINWGWVLTPQPNSIPTDGSTIDVYVDGIKLGNPTYNIYREDISVLFPGYANSSGGVGYFRLDTTAYENGIHTIQWAARDSGGNSDGIGSRYFTIQNTGSGNAAAVSVSKEKLSQIPMDYSGPVEMNKGFDERIKLKVINGFEDIPNIEINELDRLQVQITSEDSEVSGYLLSGNKVYPLPIGSTLRNGTFHWSAGPGFLGTYHLAFVIKGGNGDVRRKDIQIIIRPK